MIVRPLFLLCFLFYFSSAVFAGDSLSANKNQGNKVCFQSKCFDVEIVKTPKDRQKGLQNRESLEKNKGMLFVFEKSKIYSFWMKDTLIPLDIIWLDRKKRVVFISENVPPCKKNPCPVYSPHKKAKYVLEIRASVSKDVNIVVGEKAAFSFKK